MINPVIRDRLATDYSNIGAIVCRTPKTLHYSYTVDDELKEYDHRCELISSVDDLIKYFGDPYIDPHEYSDLLLIYDLVSRNNLVYVSSVYEMKDNNDNFRISYNGYTEFTFTDSNGYDNIGYKLKSDIKFCQPIIHSKYSINRLDLFVDLYLLDKSIVQDESVFVTFDRSHFYKTLHFVFDTSRESTTDKLIIDTLWSNGLELQLVNVDPSNPRSFIDMLKQYSKLTIYFESYDPNKEEKVIHHSDNTVEVIPESYDHSKIEQNTPSGRYWYKTNYNSYNYDFTDESIVIDAYTSAIELLADKKPEPHMLCMSKLYKSVNITDNEGNIVRSVMTDLDYESYIGIQAVLLSYFTEDCNTYLFISTPDISFSKLYDILLYNSTNDVVDLPQQYNCDLYFGSAGDYIDSSLKYGGPTKVFYSSALLSFYNLLNNKSIYMTNSVVSLNIPNMRLKSSIPESSAKKLSDLRCNSIVLFDTTYPSIYGDRSLSLSPNLRYSHISRNFVRIRRLVREYLETKKFILNTNFNIRTCVNYIKTDILNVFLQSGIISDYSIDFSIQRQTVTINIVLLFSAVAESISLEFVI